MSRPDRYTSAMSFTATMRQRSTSRNRGGDRDSRDTTTITPGMTGLEKHHVLPKPHSNPNIPQGVAHLPLHPLTLWPVGTIPSVLVFPEELDHERLEEAISCAAGQWPNICGRYMRVARSGADGESDFALKRTCSPIPICYRTYHTLKPFPTDDVIQPTLDPYLTPLSPSYFRKDSGQSLIAFRLTTILPSKQSVLGINWAQGLGDVSTANRFLRHLSHFYTEGPDAMLPPDEVPSFFPHVHLERYPPTEEMIKKHDVVLNETWLIDDANRAYEDHDARSQRLVFRLTRAELKKMKEECGIEKIKEMDVLSAWWVTVLERAGIPQIKKLIYAINYRKWYPDHPNFPPNLTTISANTSQIRYIPLDKVTATDSVEKTRAVAQTITEEIQHLKENPEEALDWLSVAAHRLEQCAKAGKGQFFIPPDGEAIVDSNLDYDWAPLFGHKDRSVAFHTKFSACRSLRIYPANPTADHSKPEDDIELTFNVKKGEEMKKIVTDIIEGDRKRWHS